MLIHGIVGVGLDDDVVRALQIHRQRNSLGPRVVRARVEQIIVLEQADEQVISRQLGILGEEHAVQPAADRTRPRSLVQHRPGDVDRRQMPNEQSVWRGKFGRREVGVGRQLNNGRSVGYIVRFAYGLRHSVQSVGFDQEVISATDPVGQRDVHLRRVRRTGQ